MSRTPLGYRYTLTRCYTPHARRRSVAVRGLLGLCFGLLWPETTLREGLPGQFVSARRWWLGKERLCEGSRLCTMCCPVHASAALWGHSDMWWARKQLPKAVLE